MSGDCPECGLRLQWGGAGWLSHTQEYHQATRRWLLRTIARQLQDARALKAWLDELVRDDLVGFRWRNGVYPGWQLEDRWGLPREWWEGSFDDTGGQEFILRVMREHLTSQLKAKHGLVVNQATWFHKVYE